ncbi:MAG: PadR family transcriptional regulator [Anaerolineae bacterium]|nr:PadR family transcriptional regulator [Anaerolineae bacterium]
MTKAEFTEQVEKLTQELRRGIVTLAVLSQLDEPQYGYSLLKRLGDKGMEVDQGTVYPLLRRLEQNGLLQSEWDTEGSRPRRYYQISPLGREVLAKLCDEWIDITGALNVMLDIQTPSTTNEGE